MVATSRKGHGSTAVALQCHRGIYCCLIVKCSDYYTGCRLYTGQIKREYEEFRHIQLYCGIVSGIDSDQQQ
ncbi:hypothetical protein RB195_013200 [Necator americanus]|uniref:Uncharacterized protein n=1 Tax=Necator americanus TaxID=51031 RepID=A0ABR1DUD6_NECAM